MTETAYDTVDYPSRPLSQAHPDKLATAAVLHGLEPPPLTRFRMLELGCGDAANLIPLALEYPDAHFLGIDLAPGPVARGRSVAERLGLRNLELRAADVTAFPADAGQFDYVLAHGLFSWVPEPVRLAILRVYRDHLSPGGVGYLSYNAFPGCRVRQMFWDMFRLHTPESADPAERVRRSRELLDFLKAGVPADEPLSPLVRKRAEDLLADGALGVLFHDDLSSVNQPYYFREFVALARAHGLEYLAEADFFEMQTRAYPPAVRERLMAEPDRVEREQLLDFLKARQFRQTLLVKAGRDVKPAPEPEVVERFHLLSPVEPDGPIDLAPKAVMRFKGPQGARMGLDHPLSKATLLTLRDAWPTPVPFAEVLARATARLPANEPPTDDDREILRQVLLAGFETNLLRYQLRAPRGTQAVSARPVASPLIRLQLSEGERLVTTLYHTLLDMDKPLDCLVLQLADGTRTLPEIAAALEAIQEPGPAAAGVAQLEDAARQTLTRAARVGALVG